MMIEEKISEIEWVAKELFRARLVTGTTGNISFKCDDRIYISRSGSCFGKLQNTDFAVIDIDNNSIIGKPSKEYPLHCLLYKVNEDNGCVIHTHSFYSTLFSMLIGDTVSINELFSYTPYLKMKSLGNIRIIDYYEPGSDELFKAFENNVDKNTRIYLLKNHGAIVTGKNTMEAYSLIEELEMSCRIALAINKVSKDEYGRIKGTE